MKKEYKYGSTLIHQHLIGSMRNFVYTITNSGESFLLDSQKDLSAWEETLTELGSQLKGILLTHTHHDHVAGIDAVAEKYNVPIYLHAADVHRLAGKSEKVRSLAHPIQEGMQIPLGKTTVHVLHTPGHSAGECSYLLKDEKPWQLFTGDTIFVGLVGRTDLDTGSTQQMLDTIQRIKALPQETVLLSGHDYGSTWTTTVGREIKESQAFSCRTVEELDACP